MKQQRRFDKSIYKWSAFVLVVLLVTGCSGGIIQKLAPGMVDEGQINRESAAAYQQVLQKSKLSTDRELTALVKRVGMRIAKASGEPFQWEINLIEGDELNAWCMPGGKMAVYTGILPVLKTEGALASVLGHEVAHATERHGEKGYAQAIESQLAVTILGAISVVAAQTLCESETCAQLTQLGGAAGALGVTFFQRKFSREDETVADRVGQQFMAKAGYDPAESIRVWERMDAATGGQSAPEFLSTHPSHDTRRANLNRWLAEANELYKRAPTKFGVGQQIPAR